MFYTKPSTPAADPSPIESITYTKRGVDTTLAHIISLHAANNVIDATYLSSDSVTPSGEQLGDTCRVEASLCQAECCPQTGAASTPICTHLSQLLRPHDAGPTRPRRAGHSHDDGIVLVLDERVLAERLRGGSATAWAGTRLAGKRGEGGGAHTWTSCALTGLVATTLRAGADAWKERWAAGARRPRARDFLSIWGGRTSRTTRRRRERASWRLLAFVLSDSVTTLRHP